MKPGYGPTIRPGRVGSRVSVSSVIYSMLL